MTLKNKKIISIALLVIVIILIVIINRLNPKLIPYLFRQEQTEFMVEQVIDGDTILLTNGEQVRYIGIDAPEMGKMGMADDCYAQEAKEYNRRLVQNKIFY